VPKPRSSRKPRLLVVEDEAVVAIDIRGHLERLGYAVVEVTDTGEDACRLAAELEPDLVLMDIQLRGAMDGIEAGAQIRRQLSLPVIYLTAYADEETLGRAKATGPHAYVLKPFDERDLHVTLEVALHKHRLERRLEASHAELLALLEALPTGAVLVADDDKLRFLNSAARRMLGVEEPGSGSWREVLGLPAAAVEALARLWRLPAAERRPVHVEAGSGCAMEVELADDPRSSDGRIVFLRDISELRDLRLLLDDRFAFENIVGESEPMQRVFQLIRDLAPVDVAVLVRGETGTGKELVANAVHRRSRRREGPFVAVNCGGLSDELAASHLFGHKRGSFTGAIEDHAGYFEAADGGSLFLDEIGELSPKIQASLLRVLEEGVIVRVGESQPRRVDVRLIAATHRELEADIETGEFRRDLFFRIRAAQIDLPPLRQRRQDIPPLVQNFLGAFRARQGNAVEGLATEAAGRLLAHDWPGNVRELKHAVEFAAIRCRSREIGIEDLPPEIAAGPTEQRPTSEPDRIRAAISQAGGNRKKAAEILGLSRATLYRRLKQLGLE
jgi:DNA-binding NtrC family response regulator